MQKYGVSVQEFNDAYAMPYGNENLFVGCNEFALAVWDKAIKLTSERPTYGQTAAVGETALKILNTGLTAKAKNLIKPNTNSGALAAADIEAYLSAGAKKHKDKDKALAVVAKGGQITAEQGTGFFVLPDGVIQKGELHALFHLLNIEKYGHLEVAPTCGTCAHIPHSQMGDYWSFAVGGAAAAAQGGKTRSQIVTAKADTPLGQIILDGLVQLDAGASMGTPKINLNEIAASFDGRIQALQTLISQTESGGFDAAGLKSQKTALEKQKKAILATDMKLVEKVVQTWGLIESLRLQNLPFDNLKPQLQGLINKTPIIPANVAVNITVGG